MSPFTALCPGRIAFGLVTWPYRLGWRQCPLGWPNCSGHASHRRSQHRAQRAIRSRMLLRHRVRTRDALSARTGSSACTSPAGGGRAGVTASGALVRLQSRVALLFIAHAYTLTDGLFCTFLIQFPELSSWLFHWYHFVIFVD